MTERERESHIAKQSEKLRRRLPTLFTSFNFKPFRQLSPHIQKKVKTGNTSQRNASALSCSRLQILSDDIDLLRNNTFHVIHQRHDTKHIREGLRTLLSAFFSYAPQRLCF
eukprot:GHVS01004284.1.p1 GENE.GHVS01004284.1~~GHVS01004284.1.p1  ORF type:complete len:111 (-),score=9.15 GHVS01004284.1:124-456(-)